MSAPYHIVIAFEINRTLLGLSLTSLIPFPDSHSLNVPCRAKPNYAQSKPLCGAMCTNRKLIKDKDNYLRET